MKNTQPQNDGFLNDKMKSDRFVDLNFGFVSSFVGVIK